MRTRIGLVGAALAAVLLAGTGSSRPADRDAAGGHRLPLELQRLLAAIQDAELGRRGFLLVGEEQQLEGYQAAAARIPKQVKLIRELAADDPEQRKRAEALEPAIDALLKDQSQTIELRRQKGAEAALQAFRTGQGQKLLGDVRRRVAEMEAAEEDLLKQRREQPGQEP